MVDIFVILLLILLSVLYYEYCVLNAGNDTIEVNHTRLRRKYSQYDTQSVQTQSRAGNRKRHVEADEIVKVTNE